MSITLWQEAQLAKLDPAALAAQMQIARSSSIFQLLPFIQVSDYQHDVTYSNEDARGTFRAINEELSEGSATSASLQFTQALLGDKAQVDRNILKNKGMQAFAKTMAEKSAGVGFAYAENFIKGTKAGDPRQFDGLQTIIENFLPASQSFNSATSGGDPLSLLLLDEAIDAVRNPNAIMVSASLARKFWAAGRDSSVAGFVNYLPNDPATGLGVAITQYNGINIIPIKNTFNRDTILPYTEPASVGGALQTTSLYVGNFSTDGIYGTQNGAVESNIYGNVPGSVFYKGDVEWQAGMGIDHPLAVARIADITDAAITA